MTVEAIGKLRRWASTWRRRALLAGAVLMVLWAAVACYQTVKPLPPDLVFQGDPVAVGPADLRFLADLSYRDTDGQPVREQQIFDEVINLIDGARRLLVLDLFLFNDHLGPDGEAYRPLSGEVVNALISARRHRPDMPIVVITDPINDIYDGDPSPQLQALRDAGILVVPTDLIRLRDSNPLYSAWWRLLVGWWGNTPEASWLPHPFDADGKKVGLRTYLRIGNFKANHRKVVLADRADRWVTLVTSANPHDASSAHSNTALRIESAALARQVFRAEMEVVRLSGAGPPFERLPDVGESGIAGDHNVAYLTESAVRDRVIDLIDATGTGDEIDLAMFYLSHRAIVDALLDAAGRDVWIRVVLDPARDAFGREKSGIPNRQAAARLVERSDGAIALRWYATHGEQFHTKMIVVRRRDAVDAVIGSANYTRRNLDDYNLEATVWVQTPRGSPLDLELKRFVDRIWTNDDGLYTLPYASFRDTSRWRRFVAWFQESTGLSTF
jgi:phosphatidylserine/phosphatidylglycerophosphate/cardiolipin synthase-like enzyme